MSRRASVLALCAFLLAATIAAAHDGEARAARRRRLGKKKTTQSQPDAQAPPKPRGPAQELLARLAKLHHTRTAGGGKKLASRLQRRRRLQAAAAAHLPLVHPPYLPGMIKPQQHQVTASASVTVAALSTTKPGKAAQVPTFADLFLKKKSKQVSFLLQKLAKDPAAMRLMLDQWKKKFKRVYKSPAADKKAFAKFSANVKALAAANLKNPNYFQALNQYSDLSWADLKLMILRPIKKLSKAMIAAQANMTLQVLASASVPQSVDWRAAGKVTPVGNQGQCGSCYIWGAMAAVESKVLLQSGKKAANFKINLSEGQLVDCLRSNTCEGGNAVEVLQRIASKGVVTEARYAYGNAVNGQQGTCKSTSAVPKNEITRLSGQGYQLVASRSATALMQAVARQPVAFAFAASSGFTWGREKSIYRQDCAPGTNHLMLLVGYNRGSGPGKADAYWIVKNSWGTEWMDSGFVKLPMLADGTLGYCNMYEWGGYIPTSLISYPSSGSTPTPKPSPSPSPAPSAGCGNAYSSCPSWASQGDCATFADWMVGTPDTAGYCQASCKMCASSGLKCQDLNSNCPYWASVGKCDSSPAFMTGTSKRRGACLESCGLCDGDEDTEDACSDWYDDCSYWSNQGYCASSSRYREWMQAYCPYSCSVCDEVVTDNNAGQCSNADEDCPWFASQGYCSQSSIYAPWMRGNCKEACGLCEQGCVDANIYCWTWAVDGQCSKFPSYMESNCPLACGLCAPGGRVESCFDTEPENCETWAYDEGYCDPSSEFAPWMEENCAYSCGACQWECADFDADCANWAAGGYCDDATYGETVTATCYESCGYDCEQYSR
ncbi:hypothetical protein D9Q98_003068 [Chlorella vulgaris]|uniref:ShKT domain-containing protein n=1 Tax=Chlorella vulgaris TaxID=3077 RepID=A0A9D4TUR9_CHLVU|nr:hypothetical protein D9Q98_003068 [Chlorella vulgaris]